MDYVFIFIINIPQTDFRSLLKTLTLFYLYILTHDVQCRNNTTKVSFAFYKYVGPYFSKTRNTIGGMAPSCTFFDKAPIFILLSDSPDELRLVITIFISVDFGHQHGDRNYFFSSVFH